jgi:heme A synthase
MMTLRRLAWTAAAAAYGAIVLGSWTRINGAGLTCPGWPLCHGKLIPTFTGGTLWEWAHRLLAISLAPVVAAAIAAAWAQRDRSPAIAPATFSAGMLFVVQVLLGAATVRLDNSPLSVVLHWGTAMALLANLVALGIFARDSGDRTASSSLGRTRGLLSLLVLTCGVAFVTMCVGAYVSSSGAGLACLTLPGCAGSVLVAAPGQLVQMAHRLLAAATLLCSVAAFAWSWSAPASRHVRTATSIGLALVFTQVLLGLLNVALRLPVDIREAHAANAALLFIVYIAAATYAALDDSASAEAPHRA